MLKQNNISYVFYQHSLKLGTLEDSSFALNLEPMSL